MDIQWIWISIGFGHGHNFSPMDFFHGRAKIVFMDMDMDLILFNLIQTRPIAILREHGIENQRERRSHLATSYGPVGLWQTTHASWEGNRVL